MDEPQAKQEPAMPETPELDKQAALVDSGKAPLLTEFYDWLKAMDVTLCLYDDASERWYPWRTSPEQLFADFFGIDRGKIEQERRAVLAYLRDVQR